LSLSETLYWHDYETSSAEVSTARPVQFGGVRTDTALNIIGDPLLIYAKPTPDDLPHPGAVRTTRISPQEALARGLTEAEFMAHVHRELAQPGTCGVGYNSIRFDDEVTRFSLFRNFYDAYKREYAQGNSRWDLVDVARAYGALRPGDLVWPVGENGAVSYRLEHLTAANGIDHGNAHDALSDVYATIGLAKRLRAIDTALFDTLYAQRSKQAVARLLDLKGLKPLLHISGIHGGARHNLAVVVPLATLPGRANDIICVDLRRPMDFLDWSTETIQSHLFAPRSGAASDVPRPGLFTLKLNQAPVLLPMAWMTPEIATRLGLDGDEIRSHLAQVRAAKQTDSKGFEAWLQAVFQRDFTPSSAAPDPETTLYSGPFLNDADRRLADHVVRATPEELAQHSWPFQDTRLAELLFRYRARNFPESLSSAEQAQWREFCQERLHVNGPLVMADFNVALAAELARDDLSPEQHRALQDLAIYARTL
jgi:exodeoxyribonuclease-1